MYKVHLPIILERGSGSIKRKKERKLGYEKHSADRAKAYGSICLSFKIKVKLYKGKYKNQHCEVNVITQLINLAECF